MLARRVATAILEGQSNACFRCVLIRARDEAWVRADARGFVARRGGSRGHGTRSRMAEVGRVKELDGREGGDSGSRAWPIKIIDCYCMSLGL